MEDEKGLASTLTHREFRSVSEAELTDTDRAMLAAVSIAYEQATFTSTITTEMATEAVEAAVSLLSRTDE
jgi:hypothetical protein